jgi:hypothetical protein
MNNSLFFILILIAGISCSEPENPNDLLEVFNSLSEQKQFYYNVNYSVYSPQNGIYSNLYGSVSLNRNSDSGISSAYFGLNNGNRPNYLHSIYLKNDWIHDLSSHIFDLNDADILTDSLHSPILINPNLLFEIEADSVQTTQQRISERMIKWTFDLNQKSDQLVLVWDSTINKIATVEYKYDVNSDNSYSRRWCFEYLSKSEFNQSESMYKHQNQITHQPFL